MMMWLDGAIYPEGRAPFDCSDRGLLLGDGVFDTALARNRTVFRLEAHIDRLAASLAALRIEADIGLIRRAVAALAPHGERHALRTTVTRGPGLRGLAPKGTQKPTVLATLSPLPPDFMWPPLAMAVAAVRRNETSPVSRLKALGYLDAIMALGAAAVEGCNEVLFLNTVGRVACAAAGNVFALIGDRLVTPPLSDGVLPGIMRRLLLDDCGGLGLTPEERSLDLAEICAADAVFMCNSLRLIAPVERIGAVAIANRGVGAVATLKAHLAAAIAAECGAAP